MITAEPAVVIPVDFDDDQASMHEDSEVCYDPSYRGDMFTIKNDQSSNILLQQPGAMSRRASSYQSVPMQMGVMMRRTSIGVKQLYTGMNQAGEEGNYHSSTTALPSRGIHGNATTPVGHHRVGSNGPFLSPYMASKSSKVSVRSIHPEAPFSSLKDAS